MPWPMICPRRRISLPPQWLRQSAFRRFLHEFPRRKFTKEEATNVLVRAIAFAYLCAEEDVSNRRVTAFADNAIETQFNVPVLQTLLITLGIDKELVVRCTPVEGTDVSFGVVQQSIFYNRTIGDGRYLDLILSLLEWFVNLEEDHCAKALLTNHVLQLHEACFNCIGRHKEVLEYLVNDAMMASQPTSGEAVFVTLFARFLDKLKIQVLDLTVIHPLKYIFSHVYRIYENLDNHGRSFWCAILEKANIELPYDDIKEVDTGWVWGAYDFWSVLSPEARRIFSDSENLGKGWMELSKSLPKSRQPPYFCGVWGLRLPQFITTIPRCEVQPYHQRFLRLLTSDIILRRFCLFLVQLPEWSEVARLFGSVRQEDLVDPETGEAKPQKAQAMLNQCNIPI
eukprot:GEMP01043421.1.p1 GENE.GEMP01043421.1~~GEMP01043421.1.p1  ORF type:complete len:397 (+),score=71.02 GEMP01043421.1:165-1355(+)